MEGYLEGYLEGSLVAVSANETVIPGSEHQEVIRRIKQLESALGRNTLENEILKEAVDFANAKKSGLRARLYCPATSSKGDVHGTGHIAQQRIEKITRSSDWADLRKFTSQGR